MPFLWLKCRRPAALVLSAACKETQCLPSSKGPPSHPGSSSRCQPLPQPPQHPLHALLPPHQPPSPAAHDPPSAPTHSRRTAHAVSAPARPARPRPKGVTIGQFSVVRVCVCGEAEGFVSSDSTDEEKDGIAVSLNRRDDICSPTLTEDGPREESLLLDRYKHLLPDLKPQRPVVSLSRHV